MSRADEVFHWDQVDPNDTVGVWIWGYGDNDVVLYSIVPTLHSNEPSSAVQVQAQLSEDVTKRSSDGSVARLVWVQNKSVGPQPYISVRLLEFVQKF
jgi:hypothetical protein